MSDNKPTIYEDWSEVIDDEIQKRRHKWRYPQVDFDDIAQQIRIRINNKWEKWDQERPFLPWVNTLITHFLINTVRDTFSNFSPPCTKCVGDEGEDLCRFTACRKKCSECPFYAEWEKLKKHAHDVKLPVPIDNHIWEVGNIQSDFFNVQEARENLEIFMKKSLTASEYKVFKLLYIENKSELEVAEAMGFKTNEEGRRPGYRQIKNYRDKILETAKEICKREDIC